MKDIVGYINLMIRLLIGQCAQAWNLQSILPLKCRGVGRNSGLQAKPFYSWSSDKGNQISSDYRTALVRPGISKIQAPSDKHQAPSNKLQASSHKQQAPRF
jgi:hypothetical protein